MKKMTFSALNLNSEKSLNPPLQAAAFIHRDSGVISVRAAGGEGRARAP